MKKNRYLFIFILNVSTNWDPEDKVLGKNDSDHDSKPRQKIDKILLLQDGKLIALRMSKSDTISQ